MFAVNFELNFYLWDHDKRKQAMIFIPNLGELFDHIKTYKFISTWNKRQEQNEINPLTSVWLQDQKHEVVCKITLTSISFTTPRRGSADSLLSWCVGRMSDTSLDKDWGIRPGWRSRQSRVWPVNGLRTKKSNFKFF